MAKTRKVQVGHVTVEVPHTLFDRAIERFSPERGAARLHSRVVTAMASGGYAGASRTDNTFADWNPRATDADSALIRDLPALRARSRALVRDSAVAGGATNTTVSNVVGTGLALMPRIDASFLGLDEASAADWQATTLREFNLWAESKDCSANRRLNFYELQSLAFRSVLENGDALVTTPLRPSPRQPYKLAIQLTEADRVSNPNGKPDTDALVAGVELDAFGEHVAFHVCDRHPGNYRVLSGKAAWTRIESWGAGGLRRNAWLLAEPLRIGQTRGVPFLAPIIGPLKQLERYTNAELMAAVVSGMFTVFIKSEGDGIADLGNDGAGSAGEDWDGSLRNGKAVMLNPGDSIETANPGRPNAQFDPFVTAILTQVGMQLQIPREVLIKSFTSSYSAARAAMLDAWRFFKGRRAWLVENFTQLIYELWLAEAVAAGRIAAPGFFADPAVRRAWCAAEWVGDGPGSLDPVKEVSAARERVDMGISTLAAESLLHDGVDWETKHRQRARETAMRREAGMDSAAVPRPVDEDEGADQ